MKIRREGIYRTIDSKDFGIYQKSGWEKVVEKPLPKIEEEPVAKKPEKVEEPKEVVAEVETEEVVMPKSKKRKS